MYKQANTYELQAAQTKENFNLKRLSIQTTKIIKIPQEFYFLSLTYDQGFRTHPTRKSMSSYTLYCIPIVYALWTVAV